MYRLDKQGKKLDPIYKPITFSEQGLKERYDIQEWIEKNPEMIEDNLMIIAKEFDGFDKTKERLDLTALKPNGEIVILELKRDDSGTDVTFQGIKYASYFANLSDDEIYEIYRKYHNNAITLSESKEMISAFLEDDAILNNKQRIILISREFRSEVISSVLWLRDYNLDIKCIKIKPVLDTVHDEIIIDFETLIPLPDVNEHYMRLAKKKEDTIKKVNERYSHSIDDMSDFAGSVKEQLENELIIKQCLPNFKHTKHACLHAGIRYYNVWGTTGFWHRDACAYQFRTSEKESRVVNKDEMEVLLYLKKDHIISKSYQVNQVISNIENLLRVKSLHSKFKMHDRGSTIFFIYQFNKGNVDDSTRDEVVDALTEIIEATSKYIDSL